MKLQITLFISMFVVSTIATALASPPAGDGKLTPDERAKAIKMLIDSQNEFLSYVEKLSDAQWSARLPLQSTRIGRPRPTVRRKSLIICSRPEWEKRKHPNRSNPSRER